MNTRRIAKNRAIDIIYKERERTVRLFTELESLLIKDIITPEALDHAATLEAELTGDCVACTIIGKELGLSAYCDCDCWEEQDSAVGAKHLPGCQWHP